MQSFSPTKLGRYEILEEIGKGAMGVVYLARDPLIGRQLALKTFRVGLSVRDAELDQFRARFIREAQSAGILSHPNIVTIHDVVEASDEGIAFIAMEYVRGTDLKSVMQEGRPLSLGYVADIVGQVAEALDYAHSCKVVHRDVKPANILITGDQRVKITDFGIARLDTSNLTQEGQLLGTPNYMSPEQILGREVDHRADIFSLGVVLYELLTRHKPFQGENLTVVSHRIVYDAFTPIKDYVRGLPPEVERVLTRALEKDPAKRYQRAKDVAEELRRAVGMPPPLPADALNDTQSLASTMILPPSAVPIPPPPPPPGAPGAAGDGSLSATWPSTRVEPPPPPAAAVPRPAGGSRWPLLAALAFLLLAGAAAGLWYVRHRQAPVPPAAVPAAPAAADPAADGIAVQALVQQGYRKMMAGDLAGAAELFRQAKAKAPGDAEVAQLLEQAERPLSQRNQQAGQDLAFTSKMTEARLAADGRRFDEAEAAVAAALQLRPDDPDAGKLLARVKSARQPRGERAAQLPNRGNRAQPESAAPSEPAPVAVAPAPAPEADGRPSALVVNFASDLPEGTVIVMVNGKTLLRENFRYYEGGGFRPKPSSGSFQRRKEVATGSNSLRVLVTPRNKAALSEGLSGNFPAGRSRTLEIELTAEGKLRANLN
jgi:serine/threonine protein kinase